MDFLRKNTNYGPLIDAHLKDLSNDTKKIHVACSEMGKLHNFKIPSKIEKSQRAGYAKKSKKMQKIFFAQNYQKSLILIKTDFFCKI